MKTKVERAAQYLFACSQYQDLLQVRQSILIGLKEKPGDINLMSNRKKVEHDLQLITMVIQADGISLIDDIEKEFGINFQFLKPKQGKDKAQMKIYRDNFLKSKK